MNKTYKTKLEVNFIAKSDAQAQILTDVVKAAIARALKEVGSSNAIITEVAPEANPNIEAFKKWLVDSGYLDKMPHKFRYREDSLLIRALNECEDNITGFTTMPVSYFIENYKEQVKEYNRVGVKTATVLYKAINSFMKEVKPETNVSA